MNFNYPDFLNDGSNQNELNDITHDLLHLNLQKNYWQDDKKQTFNLFNLPVELQGGLNTITSRRPSYAAEFKPRENVNLQLHAIQERRPSEFRQVGQREVGQGLDRRASQFDMGKPSQYEYEPPSTAPSFQFSNFPNQFIKLENGLILKDQYIIASPDLKNLYMKTVNYFQDLNITFNIIAKLNFLLTQPQIIKLITFIKNLNNLTFNHKILCLVINKNGKFDLLSYPNNSNIYLQKNDLVIVDGDRGKDLVMIVEPLINLNFAILFNFLKKFEHLKSLTIGGSTGTHLTQLNASQIINSHSNEDNEFIITLPTKQVLRFATPKEVHKILGKFLEEKKAFITCFNKIKELNLQSDLSLINVEYQSDFKKLIFYYFAGFKRIDFRLLIKELFKIYKTRIWLCAVLPWDQPGLYTLAAPAPDGVANTANAANASNAARRASVSSSGSVGGNPASAGSATTVTAIVAPSIPDEYELSNDQIVNFSINEFDNLSKPNYFHSINLLNLLTDLELEIQGHFYGFNNHDGGHVQNLNGPPGQQELFQSSFNPFGDGLFKQNYQ